MVGGQYKSKLLLLQIIWINFKPKFLYKHCVVTLNGLNGVLRY